MASATGTSPADAAVSPAPGQHRRKPWSRFAVASRLPFRLLAFNALVVFLPVLGLFLLSTYERQLLDTQEHSMVQQGRVLAAAFGESGEELTEASVRAVLARLEQRLEARIRVLDAAGAVLADTARLGPRFEPGEKSTRPEPEKAVSGSSPPRIGFLYRIAVAPFALLRRFGPPQPVNEVIEALSGKELAHAAEIQAALGGRYGAATRISGGGQRSVTLYSAVPVRAGGRVIGVVLISQSTFHILQDLYQVRASVFKAFLASLVAAIVLSLLAAATVVRPLRVLRDEAESVVDRRGRLKGRFRGLKRSDEIGDLSRSLAELSRRLAQHVELIESFAADVSHEFKNPLAAIRSATELAIEVQDSIQRRALLEVIQREVARMERLLSGVREITHIDANLEAEERGPVDLGHLLADLIAANLSRAQRRGVTISLAAPEQVVIVRATGERLAQAIENLLDNALSFSPAGSAIEVSLTPTRESVTVVVADRGPGVPEEHLDRVFDRFFTYRPESGGTKQHSGLGLAIVRAVVEGHGGSVAVANRESGGACFTLTLPRA